MCAFVCVCVGVCVCERERARESVCVDLVVRELRSQSQHSGPLASVPDLAGPQNTEKLLRANAGKGPLSHLEANREGLGGDTEEV